MLRLAFQVRSMRGRAARPLMAPIRLRLLSAAADDSHDDFKPKKKPPSASENLSPSEVSEIIKKQVGDNAVMLYMKVCASVR